MVFASAEMGNKKSLGLICIKENFHWQLFSNKLSNLLQNVEKLRNKRLHRFKCTHSTVLCDCSYSFYTGFVRSLWASFVHSSLVSAGNFNKYANYYHFWCILSCISIPERKRKIIRKIFGVHWNVGNTRRDALSVLFIFIKFVMSIRCLIPFLFYIRRYKCSKDINDPTR